MAELSRLILTYVNRLWDSEFLPAINQEEVGIYMNDTVGEPVIHHNDEVVMGSATITAWVDSRAEPSVRRRIETVAQNLVRLAQLGKADLFTNQASPLAIFHRIAMLVSPNS